MILLTRFVRAMTKNWLIVDPFAKEASLVNSAINDNTFFYIATL